MPQFRSFRESAASGRWEIGVAVIAGRLIYANVRLRLAANRTYGVAIRRFAQEGEFSNLSLSFLTYCSQKWKSQHLDTVLTLFDFGTLLVI
jgi:hypothetical protein